MEKGKGPRPGCLYRVNTDDQEHLIEKPNGRTASRGFRKVVGGRFPRQGDKRKDGEAKNRRMREMAPRQPARRLAGSSSLSLSISFLLSFLLSRALSFDPS